MSEMMRLQKIHMPERFSLGRKFQTGKGSSSSIGTKGVITVTRQCRHAIIDNRMLNVVKEKRDNKIIHREQGKKSAFRTLKRIPELVYQARANWGILGLDPPPYYASTN